MPLKFHFNDFENIERELERIDRLEVVLYFSDEVVDERTGIPASELVNILVNGSEHIPPRPFLEKAATIYEPIIRREFHKTFEKVVDGMRAGNAMRHLANIQKREVKNVILNAAYYGMDRNRPSTIKWKGFDRPLFHTGSVLIPAIRTKVVERK